MKYDELIGIDWGWQSLDGSMKKSPLGQESVGKSPTDRGKNGVKQSVLTEDKGVPLAVVISGANTHDVKLLEETLNGIVIFRPIPTQENLQNLCLDAGYTRYKETVERLGYISHVRPRGEEKLEIERNPDFQSRRWVVEVCHSWLNRLRKFLGRFEKKLKTILRFSNLLAL